MRFLLSIAAILVSTSAIAQQPAFRFDSTNSGYRPNINPSSGHLIVDQSSTGDAHFSVTLAGVAKYSLGVDNDDSDNFKLSASAALGTSDLLTITSAGDITQATGQTLFVGGLIDAVGAVDIDIGSADITDVTITTDGTGTVVLDGTSSTINGNEIADAGDHLGFFAATTPAQLAGVLSDETGTGFAVFDNSPTFTTTATTGDAITIDGQTLTSGDLIAATIDDSFATDSAMVNITGTAMNTATLVKILELSTTAANDVDVALAHIERGANDARIVYDEGTDTWQLDQGAGAGLVNIATGAGGGPSGNNNEVLTDDGAGGFVSESNFTFDGNLLTLINSTDGASNQVLIIEGNSRAAPLAADEAYASLKLENDTPAQFEFGRLGWQADDVTTASETGAITFDIAVAGSLVEAVKMHQYGMQIGDGTNNVTLGLSGDRLFHDTNSNGTKDGGEEFIDQSGGGTSIADADNDTKIQVEESADEDQIRFDVAATEVLVIDKDTSETIFYPLSTLSVQRSGAAMNLIVESANPSASQALFIGRGARGSLATPTIVLDNDVAAVFRGEGYDGAAHQPLAEIRAEVSGTPGVGDMPGALVFLTTADGASTVTEALRIDDTQHSQFAGSVTLGDASGDSVTANAATWTIANDTTLTLSGGVDGLAFEYAAGDIRFQNTTHEDIDGGRESILRFKGEQSGGEVTTLATIEASHDGTGDDQDGRLILAVNDGDDADSPSKTVELWGNAANLVAEFGWVDSTAGGRFEASSSSLVLRYDAPLFSIYDGQASQTRLRSSSEGIIINEDSVDMDFRVEGNGDTHLIFADGGTDKVAISNSTANQQLTIGGTLDLLEQAAANADTAGYGQIWVKNDTPNVLYFTDDAGTDHRISYQSSKLYSWSGAGLLATEPAAAAYDGVAPTTSDAGTNATVWTASYDDTGDEARGVQFTLPEDVSSSGNVTFRIVWYSKTATTGNVMWSFDEADASEGTSWNVAPTARAAGADAVQGTEDLVTHTTWTVDVSTLGWTAGELITGWLVRDGDNMSDTMTGDAEVLQFSISVPRS